jgi:hypothetical protein
MLSGTTIVEGRRQTASGLAAGTLEPVTVSCGTRRALGGGGYVLTTTTSTLNPVLTGEEYGRITLVGSFPGTFDAVANVITPNTTDWTVVAMPRAGLKAQQSMTIFAYVVCAEQ